MPTTKQKLEFVHAMARHTRATVRQCEALLRYVGTLARLHNTAPHGQLGVVERARRDRIQRKVTELCQELSHTVNVNCPHHGTGSPANTNRCLCVRKDVVPVFAGAALRVRVLGGEEICVPS